MDLSPDKRERILAAAAQLIVRNGLQSSMAAIAEEAGVATGSLYNYFDSKEALVRGVYGRVAEEMTARLAAPPEPDSKPDERVRQYIASYLDFIWEDAMRAQLFDYLDNSPLLSLGDAKAIFAPFVEHATAMLADAQRAGAVRPGATDMIASFVRGSIRNTLRRRRMRTEPLSEDERSLIASMCWNAIAAG